MVNTDLVTAAVLVIGYPAAAVGLSLLQVAAPDLAVLAVATRRGGPDGLRPVRHRFRFWSREVGARSVARTWVLTIVVFLAMNLATAGLNSLLLADAEFQWRPQWSGPGFVAALLVTLFLDAGALFEENGWRGYALPQLRRRLHASSGEPDRGLAAPLRPERAAHRHPLAGHGGHPAVRHARPQGLTAQSDDVNREVNKRASPSNQCFALGGRDEGNTVLDIALD